MIIRNVLLFICLITTFGIKAQCTAKAGADQHWCRPISHSDTLQLGGNYGNVNTSGWQFQWFIKPISLSSNLTLYASNFINDTTIAHPQLTDIDGDSLTFYLRVITPSDTCLDSCVISQTGFAHHLGTFSFNVSSGDTVQLAGSNLSSLFTDVDSLEWLPHTYLVDPYALQPISIPAADVSYRVVVHSKGCTDTGYVFSIYIC